jgi:hypothetical protein
MKPVATTEGGLTYSAVSRERQPFQGSCQAASAAHSRPHLRADTALVFKLFLPFKLFRICNRIGTISCSVLFGSGGHHRLAVQQPRTPSRQPQATNVAYHLTPKCGLRHSLRLHHAPQRGKDSFRAELHGGNLEVAAKVKRPIPQSDGLTKPASWKNEFLKYNKKFLSFIFSSFIFAIYLSFREIFLLGQSDFF